MIRAVTKWILVQFYVLMMLLNLGSCNHVKCFNDNSYPNKYLGYESPCINNILIRIQRIFPSATNASTKLKKYIRLCYSFDEKEGAVSSPEVLGHCCEASLILSKRNSPNDNYSGPTILILFPCWLNRGLSGSRQGDLRGSD